MGSGDVKQRKGIEEKEDLYDCVSRLELVANELRMLLTEEKLRMGSRIGQAGAEDTHHRAGAHVRKTVHDVIGIPPEDLPRATNLKKLRPKKKGSLSK